MAFILSLAGILFACNKKNQTTPDTPVIEVRGVYVHPEILELEVGSTSKLSTIISPKNATDQTIVWESSNTAVATVDGNGLVTAVSNGETIISATAKNGVQGKCDVTVKQADPYAITETMQEFQGL